MFNRFMRWFVPKLEDWCEKTGRVKIIASESGGDDIYLIRYFPFVSKYFSVYVHRFMMSDVSVPHDHPFSFIGYIVKGEYDEEVLKLPEWLKHYSSGYGTKVLEETDISAEEFSTEIKHHKQGSWSYRPKEYSHAVKIDKKYRLHEKSDAPLTVIFRGPYVKNWGFWVKKDSNYRWTYYETYLNPNGEKIEQPLNPKNTDVEGVT